MLELQARLLVEAGTGSVDALVDRLVGQVEGRPKRGEGGHSGGDEVAASGRG